jgi:hypothetical protein
MRKLVLTAWVCSASVCWADAPVDPVTIRPTVQLNSTADLDGLRKTNPDHYARAMRLMTAANTLCKPGEPKRALSFTLDNTRYVAIVTITADRPELTHADGHQ